MTLDESLDAELSADLRAAQVRAQPKCAECEKPITSTGWWADAGCCSTRCWGDLHMIDKE